MLLKSKEYHKYQSWTPYLKLWLPDSTVNWDSHKMELGPRGIVSQNSKKQEGQSLQPEILLTFVP